MKNIGKSVVGIAMAVAMLSVMASCKGGTSSSPASAAAASTSSAAESASAASAASDVSSASNLPLLKVDVFDAYANYQGIMSGWAGKLIKDNFNMQFNIIAPNVAGGGDQLYQTRSAAGNLGDLILIDNAKLSDCVKAGLVIDMSSLMQGKANLAKFDIATKNTSAYLGTGSKVYGFAENVSLMPPTTPSLDGTNPNFGPWMRWDYYKELGYPAMANYNDMLTVLQQMQKAHPKSISGKPTYGISFFKDWDGTYSAFIAKFVDWYGWQEMDNSFYFINADATQRSSIIDTNGPYYKALEMMFKANQMGVLDPDSPSNTWTTLSNKVKDGAVFMQPYTWNSVDGFNSTDNGAKGVGFALCPLGDMNILVAGVNPYGGNGSSWAIGSKCSDPSRIIDFLDWYCSPDGNQTLNANIGPQGLAWDIQNGKPVQTAYGKTANANKSAVPANYGGGNFVDGGNQLNGAIEVSTDINPNTGEPYSWGQWSSVIAANQNALSDDWNSHMGATSVLSWLQSNNKIVVSPGNAYVRPQEASNIQTERTQCGTVLKTASWQMAFATNQSQFDSIWANALKQLNGFGFQDVLKVDGTYVDGYQKAIAEAVAATASNS